MRPLRGVAALSASGLLALSCSADDSSVAPSQTSTTTTAPSTTTTVSALAARDWLNSTMEVECGLETPFVVDLTDGHWASEGDDVTVTDITFVDVDGDGGDEVVVEATCTGGAHGVFEQALLFDELAGSVARIGRPVVAEQVTRDGATYVTREPGYDDSAPLCCPTHYDFARYVFDSAEPGFVAKEHWKDAYTGTGPSGETRALVPGEPCQAGSHPDCVDQGGGEYTYVEGYSSCMQEFADLPEACADLDGDGYPGYPDTQ
jgi:hypothetical protein